MPHNAHFAGTDNQRGVHAEHHNKLGAAIDRLHVDVQDSAYGATGDGSTDDTTAIQAAIAAAGVGGHVYFPKAPAYKTSASLVPLASQHWSGPGGYIDQADDHPARIQCTADVPVIDAGDVLNVTIENLQLRGTSASGSMGINADVASGWLLRNLFLDTFGDQAIYFGAGIASVIQNVFVQNALTVRTGRSGHVGCVDIGGSDHFLHAVNATASVTGTGNVGSGYLCGILLRAAQTFMTNCTGHFSQTGIALLNPAGTSHRITGCRADFNQGSGFYVDSSVGSSVFTGCTAYRNSRTANGAYPGFYTLGVYNTFVGCNTEDLGGDTVLMSAGFYDNNNNGPAALTPNVYIACRAIGTPALFSVAGVVPPRIINPLSAPATPTISADQLATNVLDGPIFKVNVTQAGGFTVLDPTNAYPDAVITYDIKNSSGGAMAGPTFWGTILLAGAWVNPANTKRRTISFYFDGTSWVETARAGADI